MTAPHTDPNRPPFETFKKPTCRGALALGTACGHCEKCEWERARVGIIVYPSAKDDADLKDEMALFSHAAASMFLATEATLSGPLNQFGVRRCRGHWHVTSHGEDVILDDDPFPTCDAALDMANLLNRNASAHPPNQPPLHERPCPTAAPVAGIDVEATQGAIRHAIWRIEHEATCPVGAPAFGTCNCVVARVSPILERLLDALPSFVAGQADTGRRVLDLLAGADDHGWSSDGTFTATVGLGVARALSQLLDAEITSRAARSTRGQQEGQ